jgi:hypothetical protein
VSCLDQSLRLHRRLDGRAGANPFVPRLQVGQAHEVGAGSLGPIGDREQIRIGDREIVAGQILLVGQLLVNPGVARLELVLDGGLVLLGRARAEERRETLVKLGADEGEP